LTKCRKGDLLAIPVAGDQVAVAQVIEPLKGNVLVAVHPDLFDAERVKQAESLALDEPVLLAETMDLRIKDGTWPVVGHREVPAGITAPTFKVWVEPPGEFRAEDVHGTVGEPLSPGDAERLRLHTSYSPALIEHAIRAYHGHGPWLDAFDELTA
jgi:hypothetical protein